MTDNFEKPEALEKSRLLGIHSSPVSKKEVCCETFGETIQLTMEYYERDVGDDEQIVKEEEHDESEDEDDESEDEEDGEPEDEEDGEPEEEEDEEPEGEEDEEPEGEEDEEPEGEEDGEPEGEEDEEPEGEEDEEPEEEEDEEPEGEEDEEKKQWVGIREDIEERHKKKLEALITEFQKCGDSEEVAAVKAYNSLLPLYREDLKDVLLEDLK